MNQRMEMRNAWWRWPLVPLASILVAAVGAIAVTIFQEVAVGFYEGYSKEGWFHIYIYPLIPCALFGYLLAGTALRVAPRAQMTAAVTMTAIMSFVLIALTAFSWSAGVPGGDAIQTTVGSVAMIGAAVMALMHDDDERPAKGTPA